VVERERIDELATGRTHGGVVALVGERRFLALDEMLTRVGPTPFLVMIDGVEDPYNFGSALRSVYAAGAGGLLLRPRNWLSATAVVARASAGASEMLPAAIADDLESAANVCRGAGLTVVVADEEAEMSLYDADLTGPLLLIVGGEHRGVTRSFRAEDMSRVRVPYARGDARSLGTAATAAVLAFEILRQRLP